MKTIFVIRMKDGYEIEAHDSREEAQKAVAELEQERQEWLPVFIHEEFVTYPDDPRMPS
jgi:hypothetical protein